MLTLATIALVFVPMGIEASRAAANERTQLARGGIEPDGDVYRAMRWAYPAAFLAMIAEGAWRADAPFIVPGAALFAIAKALKWWAILSLGPFWTFRVIVVRGASLVRSGPYRWMRHPNYLAVFGELAAVALVTGARVAGPVATALFTLLMLKRLAVENRALGDILAPAPSSQPRHRA
jgi:methyltransferase